MILEKILSDVSLSAFMETYFLKLPYAQPGGCQSFSAQVKWIMIETILARDDADVIVGRVGQARPGPNPKSTVEARTLLADGFTIGIRHVERHDPALCELADAFQRDLAAPVDIHLYCTPAGQPGFGWHYDAEDVFIFQCSGSKEWLLRKNTVNPWPLIETLPANMRYEREIMPLMRCRLETHDWLYVPGGYWHHTEAGEESISLSIGIRSLTALDAYDFLRERLRATLEWRQRLPPLGEASKASQQSLLCEYQQLFRALGQHLTSLLSDESFIRDFIKTKRMQNRCEM